MCVDIEEIFFPSVDWDQSVSNELVPLNKSFLVNIWYLPEVSEHRAATKLPKQVNKIKALNKVIEEVVSKDPVEPTNWEAISPLWWILAFRKGNWGTEECDF